MRKPTVWVVALGGVSVLMACQDTPDLRRQGGSCERYSIAPEGGVTQDQGGFTITSDLDCDGRDETIAIRYSTQSGVTAPTIAVESPTMSGTHAMILDRPPQHAVIGDLDGDGLRDIVFSLVTESTVFTRVILFAKDGPYAAPQDRAIDWRVLQYIHDENTPQECISSALPSIERIGEQSVIRLPYGAYTRDVGSSCGQETALLLMANGQLTTREGG